MSCVESLLADMAGVMEDQASSDLTIRCQDKETRCLVSGVGHLVSSVW
jgi:hypothetical protein